jgi:hypothetical protein
MVEVITMSSQRNLLLKIWAKKMLECGLLSTWNRLPSAGAGFIDAHEM